MLKKLFFFFFVFFCFFLANVEVIEAATAFCESFSASVDGSTVKVKGRECAPNGHYTVRILNDNEDAVEAQGFSILDGNFDISFHIDSVGNYKADLIFAGERVAMTSSFSISISTPLELECGDFCDNNSTCPEKCPCTFLSDRQQWICLSSPAQVPGSTTDNGSGTSEEPQPASDLNVFCDGDRGIETALGCIPFTVDGLVEFILKNLMGLIGSVALIMIVYGSFLVMASSGSPEKVSQGKEIITAAISGLLFAILSIFILRLVGVTWLGIPGFN